MAVWLELRCDTDGFACLNKTNRTPMALATNSNIQYVLGALRKQAKAKGWNSSNRTGWICPECLSQKLVTNQESVSLQSNSKQA